MKLIVGLGNPGEEYKKTRHNVGFMLIDLISNKISSQESNKPTFNFDKYIKGEVATFKSDNVKLLKPMDFMNASGFSVKKLLDQDQLSTENIYIIHDDLDLELGQYKIQFGVGPKVHNGVNDIEEKLKSKNFWRIRVGVDNRDPEARVPGEDYVLQNFNSQELDLLTGKVFPKICDDVLAKLQNG